MSEDFRLKDRFTVQDLHYNNLLKEMQNKKIYEKITDECFAKIERANEVIKRDFTEFKIPFAMMGQDKYNFTECVCHVIFTLRKAGFYVRFTYPNKLLIFWPNYEKIDKEIKKVHFLKYEDHRTKKIMETEKTLRPITKNTHQRLQSNPFSDNELLITNGNIKYLTLPENN